jgi:hypothetical protein
VAFLAYGLLFSGHHLCFLPLKTSAAAVANHRRAALVLLDSHLIIKVCDKKICSLLVGS